MSGPSTEFTAAIGGHPIVARVLWQRGLRTVEAARAFLDPELYQPAPPAALPDLERGVARVRAGVAGGERIRIWGDFDADGQTATSVLWLGLRAIGADVDYTIPDRATHSHGLNEDGLRRAAADGVSLLITCDCAVTDFEQVATARGLGLDVIISDHHDLGDRLPDALAVINPKRLPAAHPLHSMPGVGVAYKMIEALAGAGVAAELLDLVALGIVADLADQTGDTRYLLQRGLARLRSAPRPGVRAMLALARVDAERVDAETIGFQLGPRLNAAGRMATAELAVALLTTADEARASRLAARVEALNLMRKAVQRKIEEEAFSMLKARPELAEHDVIVVNDPAWDASVIGIVASSIVNRYNKPAIVIAGGTGGLATARGSARSVAGVDVHALIETQHALLEHSGGHPMAAGAGLRAENIDAFRAGLQAAARAGYGRIAAGASSTSDEPAFEVDPADISLDLAGEIERLAPFGNGNPRPELKTGPLTLARIEPMGAEGRHQVLYLRESNGHTMRVVRWRGGLDVKPDDAVGYDLRFTLHRNEHNGRVEAQLSLQALTGHVSGQAAAPVLLGSAFEIEDARPPKGLPFDMTALRARLEAQHGAEAINWLGPPLALTPRPILVIEDAPPSPDALREALERAQPQRVILATGSATGDYDSEPGFMRGLAGMLKSSDANGDSLDDEDVIARMAARVNHRGATILAGIALLKTGEGKADLRLLLEETRAYRAYINSAPAEKVLRVPDRR